MTPESSSGRASRDRTSLVVLVALAIDNAGTGLFLPLALVYATRAVGLDLATAGTTITAASAVGLVVPAVAGRLVHAVGSRLVVVASQLIQLAGAAGYLLADGRGGIFVAALLMAVGAQLFFCSVFLLLASAARDAAKERTFAVVGIVRGASFGIGNLLGALTLSLGDLRALHWMVAANAVSFGVAALLQLVLIGGVDDGTTSDEAAVSPLVVLRDRRFVRLIIVTLLLAITTDVALVGVPVYLLDVLQTPDWLPGVVLAWNTLWGTLYGVRVVERLRGHGAVRCLQLSALIYLSFVAMLVLALVMPNGAVMVVFMLAAALVWSLANKVFYPFTNALSLELAPSTQRPAYLAMFQYAFTVAQVAAPGVVALFALGDAWPWVVLIVCCGAGLLAAFPLRAPQAQTQG